MEVKDTARYGLFGGGDMIHYGTMEEMLAKGKEMASAKADVCYTISSLTFVGDEPREGVSPHCATSRIRLLIIVVNRSFQSIVFPEYG